MTKYSKCKCGETAFDMKPFTVLENGIVTVRNQYRCRNCRRLLKTKKNQSNANIFNTHTQKEIII